MHVQVYLKKKRDGKLEPTMEEVEYEVRKSMKQGIIANHLTQKHFQYILRTSNFHN